VVPRKIQKPSVAAKVTPGRRFELLKSHAVFQSLKDLNEAYPQ
jgi:hypothetical protein